jgi:hypothetical protein
MKALPRPSILSDLFVAAMRYWKHITNGRQPLGHCLDGQLQSLQRGLVDMPHRC